MSRHPALTESAVTEALLHDKGSDVQLVSWTTEDFLAEGDNYASCVTCVRVVYIRSEEPQAEATYIAKLKKRREGGSSSYFDDMTFEKEGRFLTELCPLLNAELLSVGLPPLQVPRCCHSKWREGQDYLLMVDVRPKGFKRYDRKKVVDDTHVQLVLQELAKLHAASFLLRQKIEEDLSTKYGFLAWEWFNYSAEARKEFNVLLPGSLLSSSTLADLMGFASASEWFKNASSRGSEIIEEQLKMTGVFDVVGHGDCCTNNFLFRYDAQHNPVEVLFLDFQLCRQASLAVDLNYFLFSNVSRSDRKEKVGKYLSLYHSSFSKVLSASGKPMPFSLDQMTEEFNRKNSYGIICASILIPLLVSETEEVLDFDTASGGRAKDYVEEMRKNAVRMLAKNPLLKHRMSDLFEDLKECHKL